MLYELLTVPVAYANVGEFVYKINRVIINPLIIAMFAVALVVFLWGVVEYLGNPNSDEQRTKAKQHVLWGIVGIFIMISVFAIMQLIASSVGAGNVDLQN